MGSGLDEFSMSAGSILKIKEKLSQWPKKEAIKITEQVLKIKNTEIKAYLENIK